MPLIDQKPKHASTKSLDVFLVEDETLIRMMIAGMVEDLGHHVVVEAADIDQAVAIAQSNQFDLAILDINVAERRIDPVAALLAEREIPFIFASGYGRQGVPRAFGNYPVLQKPFLTEALRRTIVATLARHC
jgi:CheY-like chemotaxis protein